MSDKYTQGICADGVAILCDGEPMSVDQIVFELNVGNNHKQLYQRELKERMDLFILMLKCMTNGEWDQLKKSDPFLHDHVRKTLEYSASKDSEPRQLK